VGDLVDTTGQPAGGGDGFSTTTCQVQLSIISIEVRLDAMPVSDTGDVSNVQNE